MAYKRSIKTTGLMFSAISAMIGSGWLFSSLYASKFAGPGAVIAWSLGSLLIIVIALTYAELSTMFPVAGGSARFPQLSHGSLVSLFFGWITWLNLMTAPATETQAAVQYASSYYPALVHVVNGVDHLTWQGFLVAAVMMLIVSVVNYVSIALVTKFNNIFTIWKLVVPIFVAVVLMCVSFHPSNFVSHGGFLPNGWHGVFSALAIGGILFAYNGFKQTVELAGEAANPKRAIFIGIIGSILIAMLIYVILQTAFITSLPPQELAHGWSHLQFAHDSGPLAGLLLMFGLFWMAIILYVDAVVAPASASLVFSSSAGRLLYGMSVNKQMPKFLSDITPFGTPGKAIAANFVLGMLFFFPFPGWLAMIEFLSSLIAVSYVTGPVCALTFRYHLPDVKRPFKILWPTLWCFAAFYICTLIAYWTGWEVVSKLAIVLAVSFVLFLVYRHFSPRAKSVPMSWKASSWLWIFLGGLTLVSYLGDFGGGKDIIPFGWDSLALAILSVICLYVAVKCSMAPKTMKENARLLGEEVKRGRAVEHQF
jgi:amino acid transporter